MLKQIPLSLLTSNELATTADRMIRVIDPPLQDLLKKRMDKISGATEQLVTALNKDRSSDFTGKLAEADQQRDDAYMALKYRILSETYRPNEETRSNGNDLLDVFKRHNSRLYNLSYVAQSAEMRSLKNELEQNKAILKELAAQALLEEMNLAIDNFETLYQQKLRAESGTNLPLVTETRSQLTRQLNLFLSHVDMMHEDEEEGMDVTVEKLNEIITDTMSTVRARQRRLANGQEEEESQA